MNPPAHSLLKAESHESKWIFKSANLVLLCLIVLLSCAPEPLLHSWIAILLNASGIDTPTVQVGMDSPNLWHTILYGLLALGFLMAVNGRAVAGPVSAAFAVSILMEAAQNLVPTRTASLEDLGFNLIGIGVVGLGWVTVNHYKEHILYSRSNGLTK